MLIFEDGWSDFDPDDDPTVIDRSISAIEACLDPPEVELPAAETRDATHLLGGLEGAFLRPHDAPLPGDRDPRRLGNPAAGGAITGLSGEVNVR